MVGDGKLIEEYNLAVDHFMPAPSTTRLHAPREQRPSGL